MLSSLNLARPFFLFRHLQVCKHSQISGRSFKISKFALNPALHPFFEPPTTRPRLFPFNQALDQVIWARNSTLNRVLTVLLCSISFWCVVSFPLLSGSLLRNGSSTRTFVRKSRVHGLQARTSQPTREHGSAQGGRLSRQERSWMVHWQAMRLCLQGKRELTQRPSSMWSMGMRLYELHDLIWNSLKDRW